MRPATRIAEPATRGRRVWIELLRYFIASAVALGLDTWLFVTGLRLGVTYSVAATMGFCAGALLAYLASVFWVFGSRSVRNARVECTVFIGIGIAGLLLTQLLLWLAIGHLGCPALTSKLAAACVVFLFNFVLRRGILFRSRTT